MTVSLIAAMGSSRTIGNSGKIPWRLPKDLKIFQEITRGKPVIMGRKTYQSIGEPFKGRKNIILTRKKDFEVEGAITVGSIKGAVQAAGKFPEVIVIGGEGVYRQFLPRASKIYLTKVHHKFEGDAKFPKLNWEDWKVLKKEYFEADKKNPYPFTFMVLSRK